MSLSAIFGSSAPVMPSFGTANGYLAGNRAIAGTYGTGAAQSGAAYNNVYNPASMRAFNAYNSYLQQAPGTNAQDGAYLAKAESGASEAAAGANANLSLSEAQRGISPNSSMGIGGQATIASNLAANDASNRFAVAQSNANQYGENMAQDYGLTSGAANNAYGQTQQQLGAEAGLNQEGFSDADQEALQQYNAALYRQQQQQASQAAQLNAIGQGAAMIFGGGGGS